MPLADEIMNRYRSKSGGGSGGDPEPDADDEKSESQIAAGKALIAAVKRGDAAAVCEAVRNIASEY